MDKKTTEDKVRSLAMLAKELGLVSLSVEEDDFSVSFEFECCHHHEHHGARTVENTSTEPARSEATPSQPTSDNSWFIESPLAGTFYSSPSPDSPAYVSEGSRIGDGDTVCIIEAMKVMNEIVCEKSGVVVKLLVSNGDQVSAGQKLVEVCP
ncbi:MAG TPA: hypothetical protein PKV16_05580 [Caldisericia bacterium]|nr:hypothetical protein [Caldisericia bacterium]HPF48783.1 hypothetical protein [Caldisericia bacterium]HPI83557.1 hypothetical protein [Caldisericia bacterium]HPQ93238.1 hypothetical protein [Caldisericia bacterium]HRV74929.1 hypothetical protein [Caldisericia bacterium]